VGDRRRATLAPTTRALLRRLVRVFPCVVISGRSRTDVRRRLGKLRLAAGRGQ